MSLFPKKRRAPPLKEKILSNAVLKHIKNTIKTYKTTLKA